MVARPDLKNRTEFPGMVGWFDPGMLIDLARQAIVSAMFGQYADRRLIQAALDPADKDELLRRARLTENIPRDQKGAVWVDYVADLGDGFDSTYAIAYLLGKPQLEIEKAGSLPRGQILVMGGDQVYPAATRENYRRKMRRPYAYAFPDSSAQAAEHPSLLLIPGNHDWYDGLTLFLALFCTNREKKIGSWRAIQRRSYFAQQLPGNWWIWAFDSQLGEDIDQPQADYFVTIAKEMPANAKIILCASVPTWIYGEIKAKNAEEREKFYRGLDYIALEIVKKNCKDARIHAVLAGDTHHYSRYSAAEDGTQFITSGGGGAFLHPTHQLTDNIRVTWMGEDRNLSLKTEPGEGHKATGTPACYPSREDSLKLLSGNRNFPFMNWQFSLTLGFIYWVAAQLLLAPRDEVLSRPSANTIQWAGEIASTVIVTPIFWIVAIGFWFALFQYADAKTKIAKALIGVAHTIPHIALILALASFAVPLNFRYFGIVPGSLWSFAVNLGEAVVIGGFAAAFVWGRYLTISCKRSLHTNDGFSAMKLGSYRHFLRLRIADDGVTIYPVGLDTSPPRENWEYNPRGGTSQTEPVVAPKSPLQPRLIEQPITIRV